MATFVQLTRQSGELMLVNLDHVPVVLPAGSGSCLLFIDKSTSMVTESLQMIKTLASDRNEK